MWNTRVFPDNREACFNFSIARESKELEKYFHVSQQRVYNALEWLIEHHRDCKEVNIDEVWKLNDMCFTTALLDSICSAPDVSAEDNSRSGFETGDNVFVQLGADLTIGTSTLKHRYQRVKSNH
jgi:hypothetical protein